MSAFSSPRPTSHLTSFIFLSNIDDKSVIHRDLKPSNVLLTRDHRARISDFGMSVAMTGQELTGETGTYR
jgi:serine/threonine protein kinase